MIVQCVFCHTESKHALTDQNTTLPVCIHCLQVIIDHRTELLRLLIEKAPKASDINSIHRQHQFLILN